MQGRLDLTGSAVHTFSPTDRCMSGRLHALEQTVATLFPNDLADKVTQLSDVLTQGLVTRREADVSKVQDPFTRPTDFGEGIISTAPPGRCRSGVAELVLTTVGGGGRFMRRKMPRRACMREQ